MRSALPDLIKCDQAQVPGNVVDAATSRPLAIEGYPEVTYSYEDEFFEVVPPSNSSFFTTVG